MRSLAGVAVLLFLCLPVAASEYAVDATVQGRMLALIRDTALSSSYAERQMQRISAAQTPRLAIQGAAESLRRLGLKTSVQDLPQGAGAQLVADWSGRTFPDQVVVVSGELGAVTDAQALAAAMGVVEVFKRLQMKPRRTVRVIGWAVEGAAATGSASYRKAHRAQLARHAAVIESAARFGRPIGLMARLPSTSLAALEPLKTALRPLGADTIEPRQDAVSRAIQPLERFGIPGFTPLLDGVVGPPAPDSLRRHVAVLAALTWLLGEMPEALPRLPTVPE